jgi:hypothetical protein
MEFEQYQEDENKLAIDTNVQFFFEGKIDRNTAILGLVLAGLSGAQARAKLGNA